MIARLGIIILNYNTANDTIECINSIKKTTNCDYHIYLVDGCSMDDSFYRLSRCFENDHHVDLILADKNGGYAYGNNIGILKAANDGYPYILISNSDVIYYENAIDSMLLKIQKYKNVGIIGPSTRSLDQEESQLFRKVYTRMIYNFSRKPLLYLRKVFPILNSEYSKPEKLEDNLFIFSGMVRGCCFLISTELFRNINYFDIGTFLYSEEWIIAIKLKELNLYAACDFDARILHKEATSTIQNGNAFRTYHLYLSSFYYLKNYLHCNKIELLLYLVQNIINYSVHSLTSKEYRSILVKFIKANWKLFTHNDLKIIEL